MIFYRGEALNIKQIYRLTVAIILLGATLVGLLLIGIFVKRTVQKVPAQEMQRNSLLLWNMTDEPIRITFRPRKYYGEQELSIDTGARGCFQIESEQEEYAPIKQLTVYYKNKRYRFMDRELLNTIFEVSAQQPTAQAKNDFAMAPCLKKGMRYFAIALVAYGQEEWTRIQAVLGTRVREKGQYIVLSNYPKLGQPFDEKAVLQVLRA
jgi:hypothetical protein